MPYASVFRIKPAVKYPLESCVILFKDCAWIIHEGHVEEKLLPLWEFFSIVLCFKYFKEKQFFFFILLFATLQVFGFLDLRGVGNLSLPLPY